MLKPAIRQRTPSQTSDTNGFSIAIRSTHSFSSGELLVMACGFARLLSYSLFFNSTQELPATYI